MPPSRAGDVQPAADHKQTLLDLLSQAVTPKGHVRYDRLRGSLNKKFRRVLEGRSATEIQQQGNVFFAYDWTLNATAAAMPQGASS